MNKAVFIIIILGVLSLDAFSQKNVRTFIFGHSLIHHEFQTNPTPSQETSVPHWFHFLAQEAGHSYSMSGQYGFLPQHANVPPIAQWGFDFVPGAWDSDNEPFSAADFTNILITPGNFVQWQGPGENYPGDNVSPISATETIFEWCNQQEDSLTFFIYENWPDMAPYLANGFPPTNTEWDDYNNYLNGDFHDWFLEYHDSMRVSFPNSCIRMIPVGPIISKLLQQSPYNQIPIDSLYEDDAPHGRPSIYFLASLATYMAMYEEKAPPTYQVDPIIHPTLSNNYQAVVDFIWTELNDFKDLNDESRVFCSSPILSSVNDLNPNDQVTLSPNPVRDILDINGAIQNHQIHISDLTGKSYFSSTYIGSDNNTIDLSALPKGIYVVIGKDRQNNLLYRKKIVKL